MSRTCDETVISAEVQKVQAEFLSCWSLVVDTAPKAHPTEQLKSAMGLMRQAHPEPPDSLVQWLESISARGD